MLFFILLVLAFQLKYSDTHINTDTLPYVYNNGSWTSQQPVCESGRSIDLLSYNFHLLRCWSGENCSSTKEENLTPDEILHLHQLCSMRRSCEDLSLLQRSRHELSTHYGIFVDYTCIGMYIVLLLSTWRRVSADWLLSVSQE